ncbi:MAG TPA: GAF domain-containing protein [Anaerolineales bacterium]|nr:GAF domain-containing protein [Anaerolineales bacterium]
MMQSQGLEHEITQNERLARAFLASGRFIPHFLGVTGIGFLAIYILTRSGIFGQPSISLVYIGGITILLALVQIYLLSLARRNKGIAASVWGALAAAVYAILLTFFWQGVYPLSITIALIPPVSTVRAGISRRYYPVLALITILSILAVLFTETRSSFDRLQNGTPASIASIVFLIAASLLLATISIISENKNFKRLQSLLLTSFIIIVTIPTIMAAVLSAVGTFTNNQTQTFNTLRTISNLKKNQLDALIRGYQSDASKLQDDSGFTLNTLNVLAGGEQDSLMIQNSKRVARSRVENILGFVAEYKEVMILNTQGDVLISTIPQNEGLNFESQLFFRQGTLRLHMGFAEIPAFGRENLIVATPIYDVDGRVIRGILAIRSDAGSIRDLMESTPGFEEADTYLVDRAYNPVTNTRTAVDTVSTQASLEAILNNVAGGQGIYENYENESVLGYYEWFEPMQVAIISEVPLSTVVFNSTRALAGSAVLALFIISMAIAAVAISAHSIVNPITVLAQTTESFAAGKLSARAPIERQDEIGALAKSYNQMAAQLQEIIGRLEQRVNDRTHDLENQTQRLRLAAEIVRDAASARNLNDLLGRSVQLTSERFNFQHTGIYLLDKNHEFCVLTASSSEEGRQLIANIHRVRVGELGLVGRVAATGEARIAYESDGAILSGAAFPDIRSQIALPLKSDKNVIGVLDIQTTEANAFSEEDMAILQTLADQLATAIERTRLLQEVESSLKELESAYGRYTREGWNQLIDSTQTGIKGYRFDNIRLEQIRELPELEKTVLETGKMVSASSENADKQTTVGIPVKLRGQTIGVISVRLKEDHGDDTVSTVKLASERLASALESARLYEEARLRADREQSISQVATAISSSTSYEDILQTTVREIGTTLKNAEVSIQILDQADGFRTEG